MRISLYDTHPHLRCEWNEEKNGSMKGYTYGSDKKVWWKCSRGKCIITDIHHEWKSSISHRSRKRSSGCPYCSKRKMCECGCNSLWAHNTELWGEWNEEKNGSMKTYSPNSGKAVWWKCTQGVCKTSQAPHEWKMQICERVRMNGCLYCSNKKLCKCGCNSLWFKYPHLRAEWSDKNNKSMKEYTFGSGEKVWWTCSKGVCKTTNKPHEWEEIITERREHGCLYCSRKRLCTCGCNSLVSLYPHLVFEWSSKNKKSIKEYFPGSREKAWWTCLKGVCKTTNKPHEWEAVISSRAHRIQRNCPYCVNKKICECGCNSLWVKYPHLRHEWHEEKNGDMKKYPPHADIKVWWKCENMHGNLLHEWKTSISNRTSKTLTGCPYCYQSKKEKQTETALRKLKIDYTSQKSAIIEGRKLRFDFFIPEINLYIELQGEQHFIENAYYNKYTPDAYKQNLQKDFAKVKFLYDNKLSFLSISYLTSFEAFEKIILYAIEKCKKGTTYQFYYNENYFWELHNNLKTIPEFKEDVIWAVKNIYEMQFESLSDECIIIILNI